MSLLIGCLHRQSTSHHRVKQKSHVYECFFRLHIRRRGGWLAERFRFLLAATGAYGCLQVKYEALTKYFATEWYSEKG